MKLLATTVKSRADATDIRTLSTMTVRKRLQFAKMIFRAAVRHKLIRIDPFADVGIKATMPDRSGSSPARKPPKLLDACPPGRIGG